ncbi:regulatory protein GemA [Shewanella yunxiaonensis]|uniref:Regulatory protein GemA n=1 Tax=Shewanella yunxiaonensis TaxID=2829809 RepID=A0ABX7YUI5_9GAMM|nr:regulatory protein GemA [Shewanella yunxiaonensis]QUN06452.1 regulatory protein GemA [Shewanella yunxiaonensis]
MTHPNAEARKAQLKKLINVGRNVLALDEDVYRAMLQSAVGKQSLREMHLGELEQVMELLKTKGFKPLSKTMRTGVKRRLSKPSGSSKNPVVDKIVAVWINMGKHLVINDSSETALDAYVRRMTTDRIASVRWLSYDQADRVLESLKSWHRRVLVERIKARSGRDCINPDTGRLYGYDAVIESYEFGM